MATQRLLILALAAATANAGCERRHPPEDNGVAVAPAQPPAGADGDQAIATVKAMIDGMGGMNVQVSVPVDQVQTGMTPCSPQEADMERSTNPDNPELWRCRSPSGEPPFSKLVTTTTTQMQVKTAKVKSADMSGWRADPAPDDKWSVQANYVVQNQAGKASWLVDRQNLSIGPGNAK